MTKWTPDMPLRADATFDQIQNRFNFLDDVPMRWEPFGTVLNSVAREYAAACVAADQAPKLTLIAKLSDDLLKASLSRPTITRERVASVLVEAHNEYVHDCETDGVAIVGAHLSLRQADAVLALFAGSATLAMENALTAAPAARHPTRGTDQ